MRQPAAALVVAGGFESDRGRAQPKDLAALHGLLSGHCLNEAIGQFNVTYVTRICPLVFGGAWRACRQFVAQTGARWKPPQCCGWCFAHSRAPVHRETGEPYRRGSDVIHLLLVRAFVEQLLEGDIVGGVFQCLLQFFPDSTQLGRALRIAQARRIEHLSVNCAENISE